jgi:hypothetical protein
MAFRRVERRSPPGLDLEFFCRPVAATLADRGGKGWRGWPLT